MQSFLNFDFLKSFLQYLKNLSERWCAIVQYFIPFFCPDNVFSHFAPIICWIVERFLVIKFIAADILTLNYKYNTLKDLQLHAGSCLNVNVKCSFERKKISERIPPGGLNMFKVLWTTTDYARASMVIYGWNGRNKLKIIDWYKYTYMGEIWMEHR